MPGEKRRTWALEAALGYVIVVGLALLAWNAAGGGMIEAWYAEYVGEDGELSGSGAWRGDGADFRLFALLFGTWVYPLSVVAAAGLARRAWRTERANQRLRCTLGAIVALAILGRFVQLGVLRAMTAD